MSLYLPLSTAQKWQHNRGVAAADRDGTTITASATANTKGAYSAGELIAATNEPSYGIWVMVSNPGQAAAVILGILVDIGIGPSGSEVTLIPDLDCGNASAMDSSSQHGGKAWFFPLYVPDGERVAARAASTTASEAVEVAVWLEQDFARQPYYAQDCTTYGVVAASSRGTSVTAGSGADGTWTSIGTTTKDHNLWNVSIGSNDTTQANANVVYEVGIGPDSANVTPLTAKRVMHTSANEAFEGLFLPFFAPVPSGTGLWCRMAASAANVFSVALHGMD